MPGGDSPEREFWGKPSEFIVPLHGFDMVLPPGGAETKNAYGSGLFPEMR